MRHSRRNNDQLRNISFHKDFTKYAEGSVLVSYGSTKVLCTASVLENQVPKFLKNSKSGWVTAEYGMLPRSTHSRVDREAVRGKQGGRTQEIQRLIGRSLRACIDLKKLGEHSIIIDCDVIQADGGTRTAAISGGCLALYYAVQNMREKNIIKTSPFTKLVAGVSVGIYNNDLILDLDYKEDCNADTDMNVIVDQFDGIIEFQGTAEKDVMTKQQARDLLDLAVDGAKQIISLQQEIID